MVTDVDGVADEYIYNIGWMKVQLHKSSKESSYIVIVNPNPGLSGSCSHILLNYS